MAPIRSQQPSAGAATVSKKRQREEIESTSRRTRARYTRTDSSAQSVSDESVVHPSSISEPSTDPSEVDSDSDSELSVSSEDPSSESDEETDMDIDEDGPGVVTNLRVNRGSKPTMKLSELETGPDLRPWLEEFLPKLKAANDELEAEREAGTLAKRAIEIDDNDVGEGQHIEMNLGLGVLEERDPAADNVSMDSSSDDDDEDETHAVKKSKEKDVLGRLMGRERARDKPVIQEVNRDAQTA